MGNNRFSARERRPAPAQEHIVDYPKGDEHFVFRFTEQDRVELARLLGVRAVQEGSPLCWPDVARILLKVQGALRGKEISIHPDAA